jgi:hypothetical protein
LKTISAATAIACISILIGAYTTTPSIAAEVDDDPIIVSSDTDETPEEDVRYETPSELAADEADLNSEVGSGVAPSPSLEAFAASAGPSKVGVPSGYIYCSAKNRKKLAKCKPAAWHDYCTYSPDQPVFYFGDARLTVDFRGPCARHDMAIQKIVKKGGSLSSKKSKRRSADSTFKSRMFQNCDNKFSSNNSTAKAVKKTCRKTATTYYKAVAKKTESWKGKAP